MLCVRCSKEIPSESLFCLHCGKKQAVERSRRMRGNGAGTVYRRGKTWTASMVVGKRKAENGYDYIRATKGGFAKKSDALAYLPELKAKGRPQARNATFKEVYEAWWPSHEGKVSKSTMSCYRAAFTYYTDIHTMLFVDIGLDDLQDCVDSCPKGRRTRENMRTLGTLLYKYALPRHLSDMDYAQYIYCGVNDKTRRAPMTLEEVQIVKRYLNTIPYADYIYCLIYTGFRPGELLRLKKDAYNPAEGTLVGGSKTEAGTNRPVTISPRILPIIERQAALNSGMLFPRLDDMKEMSADYFRNYCFFPALDKMGIQGIPDEDTPPRLVPYSCRHTFADLLKNIPGSDTDKAALMGHSDASMTKYYQTASLSEIRRITDQI